MVNAKSALTLAIAAACMTACTHNGGAGKTAAPKRVAGPQAPVAEQKTAAPVPPLQLKSPGVSGGEGPRAGWPARRAVGVPRGKRLRPSGPLTVRKRGAVIDGLLVRSEINVEADDVTVRNSHVVGAGEWSIIQRKGHSGLRVENTEINGDGKTKAQFGILNFGGMLTVRRSYIHTVSDGIGTDHGLIEESLISGLKEFPGDHVTSIQSNSGPAPGLTLVIRRNVLYNPLAQTSAVSIYQDFGRAHDVTVDGNVLAGGGYALYGGKGKFGRSSNIKILRNVFSRRFYKKGGYYGPVTAFEAGPGNVWKDNVWAETGKPVRPS